MINLSNYEDWFLLYADGELTVAEQNAVLQFVNLHPDLKDEFELLLSMKFKPDDAIKFGDDSLMRAEYFNDLETQYRFEPDLTIQFPDKRLLYKRTTAYVFSIFRYAAVAASTIIAVGLVWWFTGNNVVEKSLVKNNPKTEALPVTPAITQDIQQGAVASVIKVPQKQASNKRIPKIALNQSQQFVMPVKQLDEEVEELEVETPVYTKVIAEQPKSNFTQDAIAAAELRINNVSSTVMPANVSPAINTSMIIDAEMNTEKQVPARGLLRKISRTFLGGEREESDGKKYVQFAVFQIPVKQ